MKTLILYPHGLGDCILATPALRKYKNKTNSHICFAMLERFKSSELFKHCPYVDEVVYTLDAWNDYQSFHIGIEELIKYWKQYAKANNFKNFAYIQHSKDGNKIIDCGNNLGVNIKNPHTDIFISEEDDKIAEELTNGLGDFGFIQTKTGVPNKNLPDGYGKKYLKKHFNLSKSIEIGVDFNYNDFNINVQFAIMKRAKAVCLADSVFYHACGAMDKKVDLVYFARGKSVYKRVKPLHKVEQNIVYNL